MRKVLVLAGVLIAVYLIVVYYKGFGQVAYGAAYTSNIFTKVFQGRDPIGGTQVNYPS